MDKKTFKFLEKAFHAELEYYAVKGIYKNLLWFSLFFSCLLVIIVLSFQKITPINILNLWGIPVLIIVNITLGISYFGYKRIADKWAGFWVNWLMAICFVISCCFAVFPWISFPFLNFESFIFSVLVMVLMTLFATLFLSASRMVWSSSVLPILLSLIIFCAVAWERNDGFGLWLSLWISVFTLIITVLQRKYSEHLRRTLAAMLNEQKVCHL